MAVLHNTFTLELNSVMGSGHSISDGTASQQLEPCFGMMYSFPDKVAGSLSALLSRDGPPTCAPDTASNIETPTGKQSGPTQKWADAPDFPTTSSPTNHAAKSAINNEPRSIKRLENDFILMDPKMLNNKPYLEILEDGDVAAYPRIRPRTRVPILDATERQDLTKYELSDLDRLLRKETTSCRDKFIPIRDTDDDDSLPDESTGVQQPTFDSLPSSEVSSFKLKPRRSNNPWDYKFTW